MSRELQIRTTTYKGHTLTLRREGRGVAVTIRRGRKHCLTVRSERGDLEGACGAALDAVTARHNGQAWSALSNYTARGVGWREGSDANGLRSAAPIQI